jgi:hypothetical protein
VYVCQYGASFIIFDLYVDDAILVCNTPSLLQHIKIELQSNLTMNDHGVVHHILGIQILHNEQDDTLFLTQVHYVQTKLELFGMNLCKFVATPLKINLHISKDQSPQFTENMDIMCNVLYQQMLVFLLMVIAMVCTQHDLTFAMGAIF